MGKYCGEPYDPELRTTEHGSRLYSTWRNIRKRPHCEQWESFLPFYNWSVKNNYSLGAKLRLIDKEKPYCPENCVWYSPKLDEDDPPPPPKWADEWNKTVNRIRKHYGMPPLG